MAKKALLDVLEQTIGKYVRNLDAESLNVAVWSGKIELNALQLDCDSVNAEISRQAAEAPNLAVPFKVISGTFAHFQVDVPWAALMSRSVVLRADGLTIEVEPFNHTATADYLQALYESEAVRAQKVEEQRTQSLELAETYRIQANTLRELAAQDIESNMNVNTAMTKSKNNNNNNESSTFATRLVRRIIENVQIEITNVQVIVKGSDCAAGVTLHSLSLVTTDRDGKMTFVDRTASTDSHTFLYKKLNMIGLGIYLDEDNKAAFTRLSPIAEDPHLDARIDHSYVLSPFSFEATLRQADSNNCVEYPKYLFESELRSMSVQLSKPQLEAAHRIVEQMRPSFDIATPLFPEYRPLQRVTKDTVVIWWKYAMRCVGRLNGRRSWVEFFHAFQRRKQYITLYKRQMYAAKSSWINSLLPMEVEQLHGIEMDRSISVDGIMGWRNIADAQARKEQEKHDAHQAKTKGSIFSSLFGSSTVEGTDAPPIQLTTEELRALESLSEIQLQDSELSSDSRLCDLRFVLGSFRVDLSSYGQQPLVLLEMGSVSTVFDANQDGSYTFDLALTSLDVHDRFTLNTYFPTILTNQLSDGTKEVGKVLAITCSKSKKGDQRISMKLKTIEAIASPTLLIQLKEFISLSKHRPPPSIKSKANPLLAQSLSGSVDLFYDATEGSDRIDDSVLRPHKNPDGQGSDVMDDISNTLIDAWRMKEVSKASWIIDFDLQAPIVVIPESCTAPRGNILVFDLGNFKLNYGKVDEESQKIATWYKTNRTTSMDSRSMTQIEYGSVRISSLTFSLGKVNYWRRMVKKHESQSVVNDDEAIVEPISLAVDFGVESVVNQAPRLCAIGVLPSISLRLSPAQLSKIIVVLNSWKATLKQVIPENEEDVVDSITVNSVTATPGIHDVTETVVPTSVRSLGPKEIHSLFYMEFKLQKLSMKVMDDADNGIEANLVSVNVSSISYNDGGSKTTLSMGWFWIIDHFFNDFPRQQRILAHSELPVIMDGSSFTSTDIFAALQKLGAFNDDFEKSVGLAEIALYQAATGTTFGEKDPFAVQKVDNDMLAVSSKVEARFSRLFINWNPRAVKIVLSMATRFVDLIGAIDADADDIIISSPSQLSRVRRYSFDIARPVTDPKSLPAFIIINASMDGLQVSLHSAIDDFPLFTGTMASTSLSAIVGSDDNIRVAIAVDDLRIDSVAMGRTNPEYRTIFGLASGRSDGILSVQYNAGKRALASLPASMTSSDTVGCEAFGEVKLSPMRMVYIQAQVLALVEYATEGILGVVTAKVVASAAQAAAELATSNGAKKKFVVRAGGFEILLPQAAYKSQYFSASVGSLYVDFSSMPDSSAEAIISIHEFLMGDMLSESLLQDPVQMDITAILKPDTVGTKDDQAIRVDILISKACFIVSKSQYNQILATLDENIGEQDLYLRDSSVYAVLPATIKDEELTHAGALYNDNPRRIYLNVVIGSLSMMLCEADQYEPLIRLSAADAIIDLKLLSDCGKTVTSVTFSDLSCDDERLKSLSRQHRSLIYQTKKFKGKMGTKNEVFFASYESDNNGTSIALLKIGSPRIVVIPDIISDLLKFLSAERKQVSSKKETSGGTIPYREVVAIDSNDHDDSGIEATFVKEQDDKRICSFSLTINTSKCSLLLVDLGSESLLQKSGLSLSVTSLSETLVLGGIFDVSASIDTDDRTGSLIKASAQMHADGIEMYTAFGRDLAGAVQILDPTKLSLYISFSSPTTQSQTLDVRCAAISPINMTLSMRNIALVNAILSSVFDGADDPVSVNIDQLRSLDEQEASRLERLSRALESDSLTTEHRSSDISIDDQTERKSEKNESVSLGESTFKLTTPECAFTLVNDLQGLDDALIRVSFHNIVANGIMKTGLQNSSEGQPYTGFDFNFHTSVVSDYFDSSKNMWKVLLIQPWELSAKGNRGTSRQFESDRPSTTIDIDSFPCHMSFSEQFLMSLASANRMWSIYSAASESALDSFDQLSQKSSSIKRSMAASAARSFISSLPYAVENHCGIGIQFNTISSNDGKRKCENGSVQYFNFDPPVAEGVTGGKRLYGQDVVAEKALYLFIEDIEIRLDYLDRLIAQPKSLHKIGAHGAIVVDVAKQGKTIVVHLSSGIDLFNHSTIPFNISVYKEGDAHDVGTCEGQGYQLDSKPTHDNKTDRLSQRFGIPVGLVTTFRNDFAVKNDAMIALSFTPKIDNGHEEWDLIGGTKLRMNGSTLSRSSTKSNIERFHITCRPIFKKGQGNENAPRDISSFVFQVVVSMILLDGRDPIIEIVIEPRSVIFNKLPISLAVTTPMPHVFSLSSHGNLVCGGDVNHLIDENEHIEVFSPGPSVAVTMKIADMPMGGTSSASVAGGWIDLPLIPEFRLREPVECVFPFIQNNMDQSTLSGSRGSEFCIVQGSTSLSNLSSVSLSGNESSDMSIEVSDPDSGEVDWLNFFLAVRNFGVDHTGDILFEHVKMSTEPTLRRKSTISQSMRGANTILQSSPFGTYSSKLHKGRVSLLPSSDATIRLLHLNMEGDDGLRKSLPFQISDVSICDGGIDSTAVKWEDGTPSGFFTYRQLVTSYQSEIHVIPEYIIFNGSDHHTLCVRQPSGVEYMVKAGGVAPLRRRALETAVIRLEYPDIDASTNPLRIDSLGLRVAILKSRDGYIIGSVAVQNVVGDRNSRFVVKIGEINTGATYEAHGTRTSAYEMLKDDYFRFRVKWSELKMTLYEARPMQEGGHAFIENALDHIQKVSTPVDQLKVVNKNTPSKSETWVEARERYLFNSEGNNSADTEKAVVTILFSRFTVDWQRVFKVDSAQDTSASRSDRDLIASPERSQFAIIIHSVQIRNETIGTAFPIVFDSTSELVSFFDLCIRFRGHSSKELVTIDLFDLNLSHVNGISEKMYLNTDEDFVWKVLDLADSILVAAAEFAGVDVHLDWDDEHEGYIVKIREKNDVHGDEAKYTPPKSDTIYHIKKTRISPFKVIVSFKRNPQSTRYKLQSGVKGANIMNYFTRRLKFKIEKAELGFAQYEVNDVKGPPDRFIELISNVYMARMKTKVVTIMTAASFQDWKALASRDGGDDAYVDGDLLRATGNVAGTTADYVLKNAGQGLGGGVSTVASSIGNTIEAATSAIGARGLGAGVNSVVTGVGDGVGDTITGVGTGAGQVLKSVGQGAGQAFGGMAGGVLLVGKGLGKGITKGDGRAVASGFVQGGAAVGTGVGQGIESVVTGTAQGVLNVGQGLFSGAKNVGRGFGGAFLEWCSCCSCCIEGEEANRSGALQSPLLSRHGNDEG